MITFREFIFESKSNLLFSFEFENEKVTFNSSTKKDIYCQVLDWLYDNGYDFEREKNQNKILDKTKVEEITLSSNYRLDHYYNISNSNNFIKILSPGTGYLDNGGFISNILKDLGCSNLQFQTEKDVPDESISEVTPNKMTFIEAAQLILKQNDNTPMSANEIWDIIDDKDLVETKGTTPWATLNAQMLSYSDNTNISRKKKVKLFTIVSTNPSMFILINPENEVQPASEDDEFDLESPTKTSAFTLTEDDVLLGDILPFTHFRGVQSQEEREKVKSTEPVDNPFRQSVCILGKSGRGKSTTIDKMLESYPNMKYDFIIPTASTTGLLAQFSPTSGKTGGGGYIPSRLGKMIMDARNNPEILYTAVFDECHKASIIEMINDELLQCISTERNKGNRFISLDTETESLFFGLKDYRGNLLLPDNFGFIFLSSKPDVITSNDDFFRRVNIYILKKVDDYDSIDYLDMVRETGEKDKNGKPTYRLNEEYFTFVEGKSKEDIQQIEKLNDEE